MKTEVVDKKTEKLWLKQACIYLVLILMVFISAVFVVFQVFEYRQDTRKLSTYLRERERRQRQLEKLDYRERQQRLSHHCR